MLSAAEARTLLQNAQSAKGLLECASAFGFTHSTPVGAELQQRLGIAGVAECFSIAEGRGALRALTICARRADPPGDCLRHVAARLSASVPHLLWIVFLTDKSSYTSVAVWRNDGSRPKVRALIIDPARISESDVQTICAMAAFTDPSESLTHLRWTEILGREAITGRFFKALLHVIDTLNESLPGVDARVGRHISLVYVSRLLFLSFVERKGWLNRDHDFLSNAFIQCMTAGGSYHRRVLTPLFFGTLNTPVAKRAARARSFGSIPFLNGGLFARTAEERSQAFEFSDDAIGTVFGDLLTRFRFTDREQSIDLTDSAIDPEILGRAFESLMQSNSRKSSGAFYTPHAVVVRVADSALRAALRDVGISSNCIDDLLQGRVAAATDAARVLARVERIRLIDPACGSGAFLVYVLETLAGIRALCGDNRSTTDRRREVLANSIFGVDVNPTAVWLCELRLWLSVVVDSVTTNPHKVLPLPNLDHNIRVGDSLCAAPRARIGLPACGDAHRTRLRYVRSVGARKKLLGRMLERLERRHAVQLLEHDLDSITAQRKDLLAAARSRNLFGERALQAAQRERLRSLRSQRADIANALLALRMDGALPFSFDTHFPEIMDAGGFDVVVGNPPWVRIHQIAKSSREAFKNNFELARAGGWKAGAERASAGRGFAHQLDLSALFVERSINITRESGVISLLLPAKLWKSLAGGSVRSLLSSKCDLQVLEDFSTAKAMFDATAYPSLLVAARRSPGLPSSIPLNAVAHRRSRSLHWSLSSAMLPFDSSPGSPWLLIPAEVRRAFDKILAAGVPLSESRFGRPLLGVKTGLNSAFIGTLDEERGGTAAMSTGMHRFEIESSLLRRILKGDAVEQWKIRSSDERIIWTHRENGEPIDVVPPLAHAWLKKFRTALERRSDGRGDRRWWRLFRTESANFSSPRVVWSDIGRAPRAAVIQAGDNAIALNTCYVIPCSSLIDAHALAALLNSPLMAAWLALIAEPAQGGYNRYLGWTMAVMPVPMRWDDVRGELAELYVRAQRGNVPCASEVFQKALRAFSLAEPDVEEMMLWTDY